MRRALCLAALLLPCLAFADAKIAGNGGDAVVCRDPSGEILSVELLDYFEASRIENLPIRLPAGGSPEEIALKILEGLQNRDPIRAENYRKFVREFQSKVLFLDSGLVDIPDSGSLLIPNSCMIEQLIVRNEAVKNSVIFYISWPLWYHMSNAQRAGAILHEAFYDEAIRNGASNSIAARMFHGMLASGAYENVGDAEFLTSMAGFFPYFPMSYFKGIFFDGMPMLSSAILIDHHKMDGWLQFEDEIHTMVFDRAEKNLTKLQGKRLPVFSYLSQTEPSVRYKGGPCGANSIFFFTDPSGKTAIELREVWGDALRAKTPCMGIWLHEQEVELKPESTLIMHPDYVEASLAAHSCYQDPKKGSLCGTNIRLDSRGRVEEKMVRPPL